MIIYCSLPICSILKLPLPPPHFHLHSLLQVERILARGNFPRFAGNTVKNIETSWEKALSTVGVEDAGGAGVGFAFMRDAVRNVLLLCFCRRG